MKRTCSGRFPTLALALAVLLLVPVGALAQARAGNRAGICSLDSPVGTETISLPVVEGKDIRFARISGSQGLAQVRVSDMVHDDQGFIWFGTLNGLIRYGGYNFKVFKHDPERQESLSGVFINSLFKDRAGTIWGILWAATWDGLCRFDPLTQRFTTYKPDPKTRGLNYYAIAEDPQGNLWLGGNLGLHRFDPNTEQFTVYGNKSGDPHSLSDNRVSAIYFDRAGSMWVGTQNGLDKFDPGTSTRSLVRIDRKTGLSSSFQPAAGSEVPTKRLADPHRVPQQDPDPKFERLPTRIRLGSSTAPDWI